MLRLHALKVLRYRLVSALSTRQEDWGEYLPEVVRTSVVGLLRRLAEEADRVGILASVLADASVLEFPPFALWPKACCRVEQLLERGLFILQLALRIAESILGSLMGLLLLF